MDNGIFLNARDQMQQHLFNGVIPFWLDRSVDAAFGGYRTAIDADGQLDDSDTDKFLVMQARMVWGFSYFSRLLPQRDDLKAAARQGVDFMIAHMWDDEYGGWYWQTSRDGTQVIDARKWIYGHSFAIYGLAEYTRATGDPRGVEYASRTFDALHTHCADIVHGGYYESLSRDWVPTSLPEFLAGRKTMNTHMHLMEAYTTLYRASGQVTHGRRLREIVTLIVERMLNPATGLGHDKYTMAFAPIPTDTIRGYGTEISLEKPVYLASYGHDTELAWLLREAGAALSQPDDAYLPVMRRLVDFTLAHGIDRLHGGVYALGDHEGSVLLRHKGWWENGEPLVAFLDLYEMTGEGQYVGAFANVWDFIHEFIINHAVGEWRSIVSEDGQLVQSALGHPWKACYHTGRAMGECLRRLDRILSVG